MLFSISLCQRILTCGLILQQVPMGISNFNKQFARIKRRQNRELTLNKRQFQRNKKRIPCSSKIAHATMATQRHQTKPLSQRQLPTIATHLQQQ